MKHTQVKWSGCVNSNVYKPFNQCLSRLSPIQCYSFKSLKNVIVERMNVERKTRSDWDFVIPNWWWCSFAGVGSRDEERLVRDLFRGYNKLIRPVQNMTQKVQVAFGLAFIQLINVVSSTECVSIISIGSNVNYPFLIFRMRRIRLWSPMSGCDWWVGTWEWCICSQFNILVVLKANRLQ